MLVPVVVLVTVVVLVSVVELVAVVVLVTVVVLVIVVVLVSVVVDVVVQALHVTGQNCLTMTLSEFPQQFGITAACMTHAHVFLGNICRMSGWSMW